MSWGQYFLAVFVAGVVCALSDWFFTMVLFPNKYHTYPEVWRRPEDGKGELQRFLLSSLLGFVTCAAFILLSIRLELLDLGSALKLAGAIWFIVPLPLLFTNAL
ncbi:MAG TPA: hypothetical protein VKC60_14540, partial [Opitutaceae bacterium]|nr:hypothetical protein [Opitutaceae bacterium]